MKNLVVFPLLVLVFIVQSTIASRVPLLSGTVDLPLLFLVAWALQERVESAWTWAIVAGIFAMFFSALHPLVYFVGYLLVVFLARFVQRQVWQLPILAMFTVSFFGTIIMHLLSFATLRFLGSPILLDDILALITLPTLFLNFLFVIPIHSLMRDLAVWMFPSEEFV
jgi:rod shape-determining protein MreD